MALATKQGLLPGFEQAEGLESMGSRDSVADRGISGKGVGSCARCGRRLTNPHSIARNLGPVCYAKSGGGAWDKDMQATEEEWERREKLLRSEGESDFGYCDYVHQTEYGPVVLTRVMRISVRYRDGMYEAYGHVDSIAHQVQAEVVFYRGHDIKAAWAAAIAAGPECNAAAYRTQRQITRQWKAQAKRGGRRG